MILTAHMLLSTFCVGQVLDKRQVVQHFLFSKLFPMTWTPSQAVEPVAPTEVFRTAGGPMPGMRAPWAAGGPRPPPPAEGMPPTRAPWAAASEDDPMAPTRAPWAK